MNYEKVTESNPIVETESGKVQGENRNGVAIFRGIPYGESTAGKNRFKAPEPARKWEGVKDCYTKNGPISPQFGPGSISQPTVPYWNGKAPEKFKVETELQGEDCLVLNVLTPDLETSDKAVLVYIHGGGFSSGSGSLVLGADGLVREQNIVLVGVNHRLSIWGYLYLGELDAAYESSGMSGMLDLVLALRWVQDNIRHFGGDPEKVTIMGESGGAMKVSTLMDMEECRGLFRAAIAESGSTPTACLTREEAAAVTRTVMNELGIKTIEDLQQVPNEALVRFVGRSGDISRFAPVADDIHLKANTNKTFRKSVLDVPLLVGSSEDEVGCFLDFRSQLHFDWDELKSKLLSVENTALSQAFHEENVDELIRVFKRTDYKQNDARHLYVKICSLAGFLGGGAFYHALCAAQNNRSPVYHYEIRYDAPYEQNLSLHMAWHTAELPLIMRIVAYPECEKMSSYYSNVWANFVKYMDPSIEGIKWERFDPETRNVMVIDDICRMETDPLKEMREILEKAQA